MHQPLIPAGGEDLRTAPLISNLQYMFEHPDIGDNHNAAVFRWCYRADGRVHPGAGRCGFAAEGDARVLGYAAARVAADGRRRRARRAPRDHGGRALSGALWSGWAVRGDIRWRRRLRCRTTRCTCVRGSSTLRLCLDWRHWGGYVASRRRRWRCPTTRMWRTRSCARSWRPATAGCSCRSTRSSLRRRQGPQHPHLPARLVVLELERRVGQHPRSGQDAGQRHQAGGPDAALLRGTDARIAPCSAGAASRSW